MIIYKVTNNVNGKSYIGQTINDLQIRKYKHIHTGYILYNAIKKYGIEKFSWKIIEQCNTIDELNEREIYWIKTYDSLSPNGYNIREGGNNGGKLSETTKEKIRQAKKGKPIFSKSQKKEIGRKSKERWDKGLMFDKHSTEIKKKISENTKLAMKNPEIRKKISENTKLAMKNPEIRKKISENAKLMWSNSEIRKKLTKFYVTQDELLDLYKKHNTKEISKLYNVCTGVVTKRVRQFFGSMNNLKKLLKSTGK